MIATDKRAVSETTAWRPATPARSVRLRAATPGDGPHLQAMFDRCTPTTRQRRFHGGLKELPAAYLAEALTAPPELHDAVVLELTESAQFPDRRIVALGSARRVEAAAPATVEVAVLVEDAWQRRGAGGATLRSLALRAHRRGIERLRAQLWQGDRWMLLRLAQAFPVVEVLQSPDGLIVDLALRLP